MDKTETIEKWYKKRSIMCECALKQFTDFLPSVIEPALSGVHFTIATRVKKLESIEKKCKKKNYDYTIESIEKNILDIAGVRIIVDRITDVYDIVKKLKENQEDFSIIETTDYIKNQKTTGYRSYHLIVLSTDWEIPIEIQIRTEAMNLWSSFEHNVRYKKDESLNTGIDQDTMDMFLSDAAAMLWQFDRIKDQALKDNTKPAE